MTNKHGLPPMDEAFSDGAVHLLEVVGYLTDGAVEADEDYIPMANIVVPTGTDWDLSGYLAGDNGVDQWIDVTDSDADSEDDDASFSATTALGANATIVPEPTSAGLVFLGAPALRRRRRRISARP